MTAAAPILSYEVCAHGGWTIMAEPGDGTVAERAKLIAYHQDSGAHRTVDLRGEGDTTPSEDAMRMCIDLGFPTRFDLGLKTAPCEADLRAYVNVQQELAAALRTANEAAYTAQRALQRAKQIGMRVKPSQMLVNTLCTTSDALVDSL